VRDAYVDSEEIIEEGTDQYGRAYANTRERARAVVRLRALIASEALIVELATEGVAETEAAFVDEIALYDDAMHEAVRQVLVQITPTRTSQRLELDDREERQKRIIALAVDGKVAAALKLEEAAIAEGATPAALYNRGVMLDHLGAQVEALQSYEGARDGADAALIEKIDTAVSGCQARMVAREALGV
jgi:hypothetical protein